MIHKGLFAICCSLWILLKIMCLSEAPIQQAFALATEVTFLLLENGVRHVVLDTSWSIVLMSGTLIIMSSISSEGKSIFTIGDLIRFYENILGYFKHFQLFACSDFNSDILRKTGLGVILVYASRLGKYLPSHGGKWEIFIDGWRMGWAFIFILQRSICDPKSSFKFSHLCLIIKRKPPKGTYVVCAGLSTVWSQEIKDNSSSYTVI